MRLFTSAGLCGWYLFLSSTISAVSAQSSEAFPSKIGLPELQASTELIVSYPHVSISPRNNGLEISLTEAETLPNFYTTNRLKKPHILAMVDPDAPSDSSAPVQFLHFLQTDLTSSHAPAYANATEIPLVSNTAPVVPYYGPNSPPGSGPHRFVFMLFNQPEGFRLASNFAFDAKHRAGFEALEFAREYNLGSPVAGTFFVAENRGGPSVPGAPSGPGGNIEYTSTTSFKAPSSTVSGRPVEPTGGGETFYTPPEHRVSWNDTTADRTKIYQNGTPDTEFGQLEDSDSSPGDVESSSGDPPPVDINSAGNANGTASRDPPSTGNDDPPPGDIGDKVTGSNFGINKTDPVSENENTADTSSERDTEPISPSQGDTRKYQDGTSTDPVPLGGSNSTRNGLDSFSEDHTGEALESFSEDPAPLSPSQGDTRKYQDGTSTDDHTSEGLESFSGDHASEFSESSSEDPEQLSSSLGEARKYQDGTSIDPVPLGGFNSTSKALLEPPSKDPAPIDNSIPNGSDQTTSGISPVERDDFPLVHKSNTETIPSFGGAAAPKPASKATGLGDPVPMSPYNSTMAGVAVPMDPSDSKTGGDPALLDTPTTAGDTPPLSLYNSTTGGILLPISPSNATTGGIPAPKNPSNSTTGGIPLPIPPSNSTTGEDPSPPDPPATVGDPSPLSLYNSTTGEVPLPINPSNSTTGGIPLPVSPSNLTAAGVPIPTSPPATTGAPAPISSYNATTAAIYPSRTAGVPLPVSFNLTTTGIPVLTPPYNSTIAGVPLPISPTATGVPAPISYNSTTAGVPLPISPTTTGVPAPISYNSTTAGVPLPISPLTAGVSTPISPYNSTTAGIPSPTYPVGVSLPASYNSTAAGIPLPISPSTLTTLPVPIPPSTTALPGILGPTAIGGVEKMRVDLWMVLFIGGVTAGIVGGI
ncbi:hypothetical protein RUND412_004079 [Rhizina undulata]